MKNRVGTVPSQVVPLDPETVVLRAFKSPPGGHDPLEALFFL